MDQRELWDRAMATVEAQAKMLKRLEDRWAGRSEGLRRQRKGLSAIEAARAAWLDEARRVAHRVANNIVYVTTDDLRGRLPEPPTPNCWGAVFRTGEWRAMGYVRSCFPSNHGRMIRRWVRKEDIELVEAMTEVLVGGSNEP